MTNFPFSPAADRRGWQLTILADNPNGWIMPWVERLRDIAGRYHRVRVITEAAQMPSGDLAFLLGCTSLVPERFLALHKLNLVVHESDLPRGRGFSPMAWQILAGHNDIPVCLFAAVPEADAGPVYLRDTIRLDGTELLPEIRRKQGAATLRLCLRFLEQWPDIEPLAQSGEPTVYPRRSHQNDRLPTDVPLEHLFDRLRVVDNEYYPAWFECRGKRYTVRIDHLPEDEETSC